MTQPRGMRSARGLGLAMRLLAIAAVATFLCVFACRIDGSALAAAFARAAIWPIVLAAAIHFAALGCKATCWHIVLAPRHRVPTVRLWRYTIVSMAASALAPVRAGEALRVWALKQRDGVPVADSVATAVCEKMLDGAAMFALVVAIPWLVPEVPHSVNLAAVVGSVLVAAVLVALALAVRRVTMRAEPPRSWFARCLAGMHVLRSPQRVARSFAILLAGWLIDLAMVELVLIAVGMPVSPAGALVVLLTINLAILVPATPAQVGIHEAGAIVGLSILHVPAEPALTFALIYHALQVLPLIAVGLALEWRLVVGRSPQYG
ncbi:MAG: hypothetical protein JWO36_2524 [Myxococcales bacterium]|nr:hypothetical protein [Myxococcales bacterium]